MKASNEFLALVTLLVVAPSGTAAQQAWLPDWTSAASGWIGVSVDVTAQRDAAGHASTSMTVSEVVADGPAARAGLQPGDRVLRIQGRPATSQVLARVASALEPGDSLELTLERNGWTRSITLEAAERPAREVVTLSRETAARVSAVLLRLDSLARGAGAAASPGLPPLPFSFRTTDSSFVVLAPERSFAPAAVGGTGRLLPDDAAPFGIVLSFPREEREARPSFQRLVVQGDAPTTDGPRALLPYIAGRNRVAGAELTPLNGELATYFEVEGGLLVTDVVQGTPADEAGLRPGDVVVAAGGRPVGSLAVVREALLHASGPVSLTMVRRGRRFDVAIPR